MKRIKLKELLKNFTEQAPQPAPQAGAPVPAPTTPQPEQPAPAPGAIPSDTAPTQADPSDYDWTKDFRAFEDAKNQAESASKKKLLDKMNKILLGKKVTTNASRGYGQPKTDYTIEKVKKISAEFWYKDYVVIVTDDNDKKYFLTPGINIKVEGAGEEAPVEKPNDQAPEEKPSQPSPEVPPKEEPAAPSPEEPKGEEPPASPSASPTPAPAEPKPQGEPPKTALPKAGGAPEPQPAAPEPVQAEPEEQPQQQPKKKKLPVAEDVKAAPYKDEYIQNDVGWILAPYIRKDIVDKGRGRFDVKPFIKSKQPMQSVHDNGTVAHYTLEIPENLFTPPFNKENFQLDFVNAMRKRGRAGQQFTRGSVDIQKVGRIYILTFVKEVGWDI